MYTTNTVVKSYLGISGSADDTLITDCITRAQAYIEAETGRVFEHAVTAVARYFDAIADVDGRTLMLDYDLCAITSVTNGDGIAVAAASYVTEPRNAAPYYAIVLKASKGLYWTYSTDPENAITVTGKWAYSATPPADILQATIRLAAYYYRQREQKQFATESFPGVGVVVTPGSIPADVYDLIKNYRRLN